MPPALDLSLRNDILGWDETYDAAEIGLLLLEDIMLGYSQTRGLYIIREKEKKRSYPSSGRTCLSFSCGIPDKLLVT